MRDIGQELAEKDPLIADHEPAIEHWRQFAMKLQVQTSTDQDTISELAARCETAQTRVISLEASAAKASERSAAAHAASTKLPSQVVAAFGRNSPVHSVLQSITLQEAAE